MALAGWLAGHTAWAAGYLPWPPLRPALAIGLVAASLGALLQWSGVIPLYRLGNVLGALVALWGLAAIIPEFNFLSVRSSLTDGAMLVLSGLSLLQLERNRREWLGPATIFGSVLLALALFGLLTRSLLPDTAASGISGLGSIVALLLGIALTVEYLDSGLADLVKSDNATGLIGRRLLIAALVLAPAFYAMQLGNTENRGEMLALMTVALTFVLISVLVFSLRRLQRIDADKKRTEEERDRLLQRVQQQASHLQQEVATRTNELKLLYERHRLALRGSHYGVWDWDVVNGVQIWDTALLAIHGLTPATFGGKDADWFHLIHPDDVSRVQHLDWGALEPDDNLVFDYRVMRPDGSIRHLRAQGQPQFNDQGRLVRVVGLVRDETQEKDREVELQQA